MPYRSPGVPATPYARELAREKGIDIRYVCGTGAHKEVRARDIENVQIRATPLARRMAREQGVDIRRVTGSGYMGKVFSRDIAMDAGADTKERAMREIDCVLKKYGMTSMRSTIARRMQKSHQEIPSVTQNMEVEADLLFLTRQRLNEALCAEERISVADIVVKAAAIAAREHERLRMQLSGEEYILVESCDIGIATAVEGGLFVPVVRGADKKPLADIARESKALIMRARSGRLRPEDTGGAVMTVSNLGMYGVCSFTPVINPPEASILGVNAAVQRLCMDSSGNLAAKQIFVLSHTYDHRIMNGAEAAMAQRRIKELLEQPDTLI